MGKEEVRLGIGQQHMTPAFNSAGAKVVEPD